MRRQRTFPLVHSIMWRRYIRYTFLFFVVYYETSYTKCYLKRKYVIRLYA